jgi:undecaprenyl-diphosphatase
MALDPRRRLRWIAIGTAAALFGLLAFYAHSEETGWDLAILAQMRELRSPAMNSAVWWFTSLGDFEIVVVLAALAGLVFWRRSRRAVFFIATAVLGAGILNTAMKSIFTRARPSVADAIYEPSGFSYPSGHSMGALALALALGIVVTRLSPKRARWVWALGLFYAVLIGLSRVYLGVHFPSDVLGGFALTTSYVMLIETLWPPLEPPRPPADRDDA